MTEVSITERIVWIRIRDYLNIMNTECKRTEKRHSLYLRNVSLSTLIEENYKKLFGDTYLLGYN